MFESISFLEQRAKSLLLNYKAFVDGPALRVLGETGGAPLVIEVQQLKVSLDSFCQTAAAIQADADWGTLDPALQRDVTAVCEESGLACGAIDTHAHPDAVWTDLSFEQKNRAIERHAFNASTADTILARVNLQLRAQSPVDPSDSPSAQRPAI